MPLFREADNSVALNKVSRLQIFLACSPQPLDFQQRETKLVGELWPLLFYPARGLRSLAFSPVQKETWNLLLDDSGAGGKISSLCLKTS